MTRPSTVNASWLTTSTRPACFGASICRSPAVEADWTHALDVSECDEHGPDRRGQVGPRPHGPPPQRPGDLPWRGVPLDGVDARMERSATPSAIRKQPAPIAAPWSSTAGFWYASTTPPNVPKTLCPTRWSSIPRCWPSSQTPASRFGEPATSSPAARFPFPSNTTAPLRSSRLTTAWSIPGISRCLTRPNPNIAECGRLSSRNESRESGFQVIDAKNCP